MPEKKIPCAECESEKERIEEDGTCAVIDCKKVEGEKDWCIIRWKCRD